MEVIEMTIVIWVLLAISVILTAISLFFGIKALRTTTKKYSLPELLRGYIKENRAVYGVCNHGISMDDIDCIQIISPEEIGL